MTNPLGCSEAEWATRLDLAALYRLAAHYGWTDLTSTHISARIPDDADHYLMNSYDLMFEEITASNLSKISFGGEMVPGERTREMGGRVLNLAGHIIHSGVLKGRPEVNFVLHSHTRAGVAVSAVPGGLRPLSQHAGSVLGSLATHPYQDSTAVPDEGAALVADLGPHYAMLLENHGLLTVGRTAAEAFVYHYYLEMACKIQVDILSQTDRPIDIPPAALEPLLEWGRPKETPLGAVQWPALLRLLARSQPDYCR